MAGGVVERGWGRPGGATGRGQGQQGRAGKGGGGRGEGKREGGGSSPRGSTIAETVHRITPSAKEVEERWERGWERDWRRLLRGKQNEIEREGRAHGGLGRQGCAIRVGPKWVRSG
jgi:hypothetical protein